MKCKNSISGLLEELKNLPTLLRNLFKKKKKEVNNTTLNKVADIVKDKMENLIKTGIVSNKDQMVNSIESRSFRNWHRKFSLSSFFIFCNSCYIL